MFKFIYFVFIVLLVVQCSSLKTESKKTDVVEESYLARNGYSTQLPKIDPSDAFEKIQNAVKRVQTTVYYTTYYFTSDQNIKPETFRFQKAERLTAFKKEFSNSRSGSAIVMAQTPKHVLFMTCEHVVSASDTIFVYKDGERPSKNTPLKSISVLNKVEYLVFDAPTLNSFTVLKSNKEIDLALIVSDLELSDVEDNQILPLKLGDEDDLKWGSIVYSVGFPMGYKMISQGVASPTDKTNAFYMLSDVHFNPGISGGLLFALRKSTQEFEWVGVASSASSSIEYQIVPKTDYFLNEKEDLQVYTDTLFIQKKTGINYGITRSIKASLIKDFITKARSAWVPYGFVLTSFNIGD